MKMLDPVALFAWSEHVDVRDSAHQCGENPALVITMGGFADAGGTRKFLEERLLAGFANHRLGTFDTDQLYDYAGHRPLITFDRDHFRGYQSPEIALYQVSDSVGNPFFLLTGPEPALQWERLCAAIGHLIDVLGITRVWILQSMPAPTPHTRPTYISGFSSKPELLNLFDGLPGTFHISSSFNALLTVRLGEQGVDVVGLTAHVPHYLADVDYPDAAAALLNRLSIESTLDLPGGSQLTQASRVARAMIDQQLALSEDAASGIAQLEDQYEHYMSQRLRVAPGNMPSGEQLGAEIEEYLKSLGSAPDDQPIPDPYRLWDDPPW